MIAYFAQSPRGTALLADPTAPVGLVAALQGKAERRRHGAGPAGSNSIVTQA